MSNTNFQTFHQMGSAINDVVRQATGRDNVQNIDMDYVTVAQQKRLFEKVVTGDAASFYADQSAVLDYIIAKINPAQEGTGDPSPENIRPISGRDSVNISRYGKNVFDLENPTFPDTLISDDGWFETNSNFDSWIFDKVGTWTISITTTETAVNGRCIVSPPYIGKPIIFSETFSETANTRSSITFSISAGEAVCISIRKTATNIQLESGSSATDFENVIKNVYTIQLPTTIYGGTLTINNDGTGELSVNMKVFNITDDNVASVFNGGSGFYRAIINIPDDSIVSNSGNVLTGKLLSDQYVEITNTMGNQGGTGLTYRPDGSHRIVLSNPVVNSNVLSDWKTWVNAHPFTIVYGLAEPVQYSLTAEQVQLLLGINNIWADTGDITVMYSCYEEVI